MYERHICNINSWKIIRLYLAPNLSWSQLLGWYIYQTGQQWWVHAVSEWRCVHGQNTKIIFFSYFVQEQRWKHDPTEQCCVSSFGEASGPQLVHSWPTGVREPIWLRNYSWKHTFIFLKNKNQKPVCRNLHANTTACFKNIWLSFCLQTDGPSMTPCSVPTFNTHVQR